MTTRVISPTASSLSRGQLRAGWIISALIGLFFVIDGVGRILKLEQYEKGTLEAGFLASQGPWIGAILLACTALYLLPRTAFFGAILLTGYLGGAVATAFRMEDYGPSLFAAAFGVIVWAGLTLRDNRVRQLIS